MIWKCTPHLLGSEDLLVHQQSSVSVHREGRKEPETETIISKKYVLAHSVKMYTIYKPYQELGVPASSIPPVFVTYPVTVMDADGNPMSRGGGFNLGKRDVVLDQESSPVEDVVGQVRAEGGSTTSKV